MYILLGNDENFSIFCKFFKNEICQIKPVDVKQILCWYYNIIILDKNGKLTLFHNDKKSEILITDNTIQKIYKNHSSAITTNLLIYKCNSHVNKSIGELWKYKLKEFEPFDTNIQVKQVCCGYNYSMILTDNNELFVSGSNAHGQLGLGFNIRPNKSILLMTDVTIKQIHCGMRHSVIYKQNHMGDEIWIFGGNSLGQFGLGDKESRYVPTLLMKNQNVF